jgi:hypothetical protein
MAGTKINYYLAGDQKRTDFLPAKKYIDLHILKHVQKKFEHKICIIKEITIGMPLNMQTNAS